MDCRRRGAIARFHVFVYGRFNKIMLARDVVGVIKQLLLESEFALILLLVLFSARPKGLKSLKCSTVFNVLQRMHADSTRE